MRDFWYYTKQAAKDAFFSYWEPLKTHPKLILGVAAICAILWYVFFER